MFRGGPGIRRTGQEAASFQHTSLESSEAHTVMCRDADPLPESQDTGISTHSYSVRQIAPRFPCASSRPGHCNVHVLDAQVDLCVYITLQENPFVCRVLENGQTEDVVRDDTGVCRGTIIAILMFSSRTGPPLLRWAPLCASCFFVLLMRLKLTVIGRIYGNSIQVLVNSKKTFKSTSVRSSSVGHPPCRRRGW